MTAPAEVKGGSGGKDESRLSNQVPLSCAGVGCSVCCGCNRGVFRRLCSGSHPGVTCSQTSLLVHHADHSSGSAQPGVAERSREIWRQVDWGAQQDLQCGSGFSLPVQRVHFRDCGAKGIGHDRAPAAVVCVNGLQWLWLPTAGRRPDPRSPKSSVRGHPTRWGCFQSRAERSR